MPKNPPNQTDSPSGQKVCLNIGDALKGFDPLNKKLAKAKLKKVSKSYVFREGAKRIIAELTTKVDKALAGKLHAKQR